MYCTTKKRKAQAKLNRAVLIAREMCLSLGGINYTTKAINAFTRAFFERCAVLQLCIFWVCRLCHYFTRKQNKPIKSVITLRNTKNQKQKIPNPETIYKKTLQFVFDMSQEMGFGWSLLRLRQKSGETI